MSNFFAAALVSLVGLVSLQAHAEIQTYTITCVKTKELDKDGKETGKDIKVFKSDKEFAPANAKFKLIVKNECGAAIEFESHELGKERVINIDKSATIFVGPLPAGTYPYFDEFNPSTTGKLILK